MRYSRPAQYLASRTSSRKFSPNSMFASQVAGTCPAGCWLERNSSGTTYCTCPDVSSSYAVSSPVIAIGDAASDAMKADAISLAEKAAAVALVYHGYRRTGSILWALLYGLAGKEFPEIAVPIAIAQGFGQRKACPAP